MATTKPPRLAPAGARRAFRDGTWLAWATPVAVFVAIRYAPMGLQVETLVGLAVGAFVALWAFRQPVRALILLVFLLPFHQPLMALTYRWTNSVALARGAGYWKEIVALGATAAVVRKWRRERHGVDWVDRFAIGYLVLGLAYLFVPGVFVSNVASTFFVRGIGYRGDVFYVLLLLTARHARLTEDELRRLVRWLLVIAGIITAVAFVEFYASGFWNNVNVNWFRVPRYRVDVLKISTWLVNPTDILVYGQVAGRQYLRVGSIELSFLATAFNLALAVAVAADRFTRLGEFRATRAAFGLGFIGVALLFTQTRSAIVAGLIGVFFIVRRDRARTDRARVRGSAVVVLLIAVLLPVAAAGGLLSRFSDDSGGSASHKASGQVGGRILGTHPLGRGLATAAGSGQRAEVATAAVTESQFLQIGTQLGVLGLALWALTLGGAALRVQRARAWIVGPEAALVASSSTAVAAGFVVGSYFHQPFLAISTAWWFCILLGAALGAADTATESP